MPRHKVGEILNEFDVYVGEQYYHRQMNRKYMRTEGGYSIWDEKEHCYVGQGTLERRNALTEVMIIPRVI